jgi:hypothetical protein
MGRIFPKNAVESSLTDRGWQGKFFRTRLGERPSNRQLLKLAAFRALRGGKAAAPQD